jgi:orotidine 5'-phosphate decarboxylase subfamily 1
MPHPSYSARAKDAKNPVAKRLLELMEQKETNLCASADLTTAQEILDLAEAVSEEICVLKTHIDIIKDFSFKGAPKAKTPTEAVRNFTQRLREIADRKDKEFLIFEDRKFADIGNTVGMQFTGGIYKIAEWADIVNVHSVTSYATLPFISGYAKTSKRQIGVLVLAQMTPVQLAGLEFFNEDYASKTYRLVLQIHKSQFKQNLNPLFIGFIGSSEQPEILSKLRNGDFADNQETREISQEMIIMTPGIKIAPGNDKLGQTYNTPEKAISNGSDVIIVGRGIYEADDPATAAKIYREAGWAAYQQNTKQE